MKLIIEAVSSAQEAKVRAQFYNTLGVQYETFQCKDATWINKTMGGSSDTAYDPTDSEIFVIVAKK